MRIKINAESFFVFDLDDTLFPELHFLQSGYRHIVKQLSHVAGPGLYGEMLKRYHGKEDIFAWLVTKYQALDATVTKEWLLRTYREHFPDIHLPKSTAAFLEQLQAWHVPAGLITDGRSVTQRNKLRALGLDHYFTDVIISEEFGSEKPCERNYLYFQHKYPGRQFYFLGDNTAKDFTVPARLGWRTVCMLNTGDHIHPQQFLLQPAPDLCISSFNEITLSM